MRSLHHYVPAVVSASLIAGAALGHGDGIFLIVEQGHIVTSLQLGEDELIAPIYTFTTVLGDSGFPGFSSNPGFHADAGTFQPGTSVGFNILQPLLAWTGAGFVPTGGETMTISFLTLSVTSGAGFTSGFMLGVQPDGGFHRHCNHFLNGPAGSPPLAGVYLLEREVFSNAPGLASSERFWTLFAHNVPTEQLDAAAAWVEQHFVQGSCLGDLTGDGLVNGADLATLLGAWGSADAAADLDASGIVNGADLALLLGAWGPCN